ncbi:PIR Superfamily Protein [Plasmodium ovale curtisi]|uniref:PIR Superfamily Protein n=1 Tax=Plasmodium ovale curtisi TaxID=864141 RepID=A0A1A8WIA0_PLAOA|nr:PIR Superfamily Protein [Plasmodium ovale curtisi]
MSASNSDGEPGDFSGSSATDLYSEQFYGDLNREYPDLSDYSKECDEIYFRNNKEEVKKICEKLIRHLEKSPLWKHENPKYDVCRLLNYWIYEKLSDIFKDENTSHYINIAFGNLQGIWNNRYYYSSSISHHNKCKLKFEIVDHQDWEKRKKLYDYCVDYDVLYKMAKNFDNDCKYYKQIKKNETIYKHFEEQCPPKNNNCPEFYNNCKQYNPNVVLSDLPCHKKMEEAEPPAKTRIGGDPLAQAQPHESYPHGSVLPKMEADTQGTDSTTDTSQIGTTIGHSILGVTPVLLTASALYRYTPIGSWLRNLGGNNPSNMGNIDGEMEGFLGSTPESANMFFEGGENYISYQPM